MRAHTLPWLFRHFEKTLLGAALVWLVVVAAGFATPASSLNPGELHGSMRVVQNHFRTASPDTIARPTWNTQLQEQLNPEAVPEAVPFGAWLFYQRPQLLYSVGPGLTPLDCRYSRASIMAPNPDAPQRGQITVEWSAPAQGEHLIVEYTLQRRVADGPWADLVSLDPTQTTVVDKDLAPNTTYSYRVTSLAKLDTESPLVIAHGLTSLPKGVPASLQSTPSTPRTTPRNTIFVINSVQPGDAIRRIKGKAQIYVYRWNSERGDFDRRLFRVQVGETIGSGAFATDAILSEVSLVRRPVAGSSYTKPVGLVTLKTRRGTLALDDQTPFSE